ncbi:MAG: hypothetical protein RBT11_18060 [Desulfobacterales bacterium]|jgi:tetratricopeptide (TPR) repeat protein|nr:hypothetical protein [Desulfobacterales bacterium]
MKTDPTLLVTATLAKAYADQGYLNQAAKIYRQLLKAHPDHENYATALRVLEQKLDQGKPASDQLLIELLSTWIDLETGYARLARLRAALGRQRAK